MPPPPPAPLPALQPDPSSRPKTTYASRLLPRTLALHPAMFSLTYRGTVPKPRSRPRRGRSGTQLGSLDSEEAAQLEAALGVAPTELPPHLRCYALRRRNAASFSGPGVLPGEQEAGRVEYKLRLLDPTPQRFQQLVRSRVAGWLGCKGAPTGL